MSNNDEILDCVQIEPELPAQKSVICLHGLGADANDLVPITSELKVPKNIRFIFPNAPIRPITINNGYEMRAWYDISHFSFDQNIDRVNIAKSVAQLEKLIEQEHARGTEFKNIILAGFSQGAVIALITGLRYKERLGGVIALSGYLPLAQETLQSAASANADIPIFMGHGTHDPIVPYVLGKAAANFLQQAGYSVTWHSYFIPHSISLEEINDISLWLQTV